MSFEIQIKDGSEAISKFVVDENTKTVELYDWQRRAIKYFFSHDYKTIYEVSTGAGKTVLAIEIIKRLFDEKSDLNVLIVVPKNVILETTWFKELYDGGFSIVDVGVYYGNIKEYGKKITITNMQNLNRIPMEIFDAAIFDECFSGDTKIRYMEDIEKEIDIKTVVDKKLKLNVFSYNFKTKKEELKKIYQWFKIKEKREVYEIKTESGKTITVTNEQLIYTGENYKKVVDLKVGDNIFVRNSRVQ